LPLKKIETKTDSSGTIVVTSQEKVKVWMQVVVSFIMLAAGILIFIDPSWLPRADESLKKVAAGWVGGVIGYWFS
jgi:VanZ family protein